MHSSYHCEPKGGKDSQKTGEWPAQPTTVGDGREGRRLPQNFKTFIHCFLPKGARTEKAGCRALATCANLRWLRSLVGAHVRYRKPRAGLRQSCLQEMHYYLPSHSSSLLISAHSLSTTYRLAWSLFLLSQSGGLSNTLEIRRVTSIMIGKQQVTDHQWKVTTISHAALHHTAPTPPTSTGCVMDGVKWCYKSFCGFLIIRFKENLIVPSCSGHFSP